MRAVWLVSCSLSACVYAGRNTAMYMCRFVGMCVPFEGVKETQGDAMLMQCCGRRIVDTGLGPVVVLFGMDVMQVERFLLLCGTVWYYLIPRDLELPTCSQGNTVETIQPHT